MADQFTTYVVDADRRFRLAIERAKQETSDLRIPLGLIAKDWFKTNRAIFSLKGPGLYADLSPGYKKQKAKKTGFVYPILEATGRLAASITQPSNSKAVNEILNKSTLLVGTKVQYSQYLQFGTKRMPARPFVFFGPESKEFGTDKTFATRTTQWLNIINDFILGKMGVVGEVRTGIKTK